MSEEKNATENTELYAEALELVKTKKIEVADAKAELRKFKKANKARTADGIKEEKLKAEFVALEKAVETVTTSWEEAKDAAAELKPAKPRGGGGSYSYTEIKDSETGEMRMPDAKETKRWRTHARKVAKKEEGLEAKDVPFEPSFFAPKPAKKAKEEKPDTKEEKPDTKAPDADAKVPAADAKTEEKTSKRRSRREKKD